MCYSYFRSGFLAMLLCVVLASHLHGEQTEDYKVLADNGLSNDSFGLSIDIDGNLAIVGAPLRDDFGSESGAAYLYDVTTGEQLHHLIPNGLSGFAGTSVSISGDKAVLGAWRDSDLGNRAGAAYVFDTVSGEQLFKLVASDGQAFDFFGESVSICGDTILIGAAGTNVDEISNAGSVYVFDAVSGKQLAKLQPDDVQANMQFGGSVAIDGQRAIVGAAGVAYVFDIERRLQQFKVIPPEENESNSFGSAVALDGLTAVVGSPTDNINASNSGSAYNIDLRTGRITHRISPNDGGFNHYFGISVAVRGSDVFVGSYADGNEPASGAVYWFIQDIQVEKYQASDGESFQQFGCSVAANGNKLFVGSQRDDDNGTNSGSAYVFSLFSGIRSFVVDSRLNVLGTSDADIIEVRQLPDGIHVTANEATQVFADVTELVVLGREGDDQLIIAFPGVEVYAGDGNDTITMEGNGDSFIFGGAGADTITGSTGADQIDGESGNDQIDGRGGQDVLSGSDGNDLIAGGVGGDSIYGGPGDDVLVGGTGNDLLNGFSGNDTIRGGDGQDVILGSSGNDTLIGGGGADQIFGGPGNDISTGGAGNDLLNGGAGADYVSGGDGYDLVFGGNDDDELVGGNGQDELFGGLGNDFMNGNSGNDILNGGGGDDFLTGGRNNDQLNGGPGFDTASDIGEFGESGIEQ